MSLLDVTDNDYTYELLEELANEAIQRLNFETFQKYSKNLERRKEQEREKIEKKNRKKKTKS